MFFYWRNTALNRRGIIKCAGALGNEFEDGVRY